MRRGFTLLEMMLAVAIFATVVAMLGAVGIGVRRLIGRTYAEAELSVRLRGLREKILFHAAPPHDGKVFAGILSGMPKSAQAVEGGMKVYVQASGLRLADRTSFDQTIELLRDTSSRSVGLKNDAETGPWRTGWLSLAYDGDVSFEDALLQNTSNKDLYFVNLTAKRNGVTAGLRLAVPVFGTEQVKNVSSVFHDNLLQ